MWCLKPHLYYWQHELVVRTNNTSSNVTFRDTCRILTIPLKGNKRAHSCHTYIHTHINVVLRRCAEREMR